MAQTIGQGVPEIAQQLQLVDAVVDRFRRTGRVGFSGTEYQQAKDGVVVMDLLAAATDVWTAGEAAEWSMAHFERWQVTKARAEAR